jgi:hypothetical protein
VATLNWIHLIPHKKMYMGLSSSFRNSLFYNRGKQKHSVTYSYLKWNKKSAFHRITRLTKQFTKFNILIYTRKVGCLALLQNNSDWYRPENFIENYTIKGYQIAQKSVISFQKHQLGCFYELQNKENQIGNFESLVQNRFGTSFTLARNKSPWMVKFPLSE